jgi:hypothetical protein
MAKTISRGGTEMTEERRKLVDARGAAYRARMAANRVCDFTNKAWRDTDKALDAYDEAHPEEAMKMEGSESSEEAEI